MNFESRWPLKLLPGTDVRNPNEYMVGVLAQIFTSIVDQECFISNPEIIILTVQNQDSKARTI
jgi:hypothetical protein